MMRTLVLTIVIAVCISSESAARMWYITPDGTGDAPTIQAGVDSAVAGDTVLVACGLYEDCTHSTPDGLTASVILKSGITLRSETGDPECAIIWPRVGRALYCDGVEETTVEGFTISEGQSCLPPDARGGGGGMYCWGSSLEVIGCTFERNSAAAGGAIYSVGPLTCRDCRFTGNDAQGYMEIEGEGGGIYAGGTGSFVLDGCDFRENRASGGGGGVMVQGVTPVIIDCIFAVNEREGVCSDSHSTLIRNCTFYSNTGAAILLPDRVTLGHLFLENSIVTGNGGSVVCSGSSLEPELACCNVYGNTGGDYVGCIAGQEDVYGNFCACPSFCLADAEPYDLHLCDGSPCLPGQHPDGNSCGLVGALGEGCSCGPTAAVSTTWGAIKSMYK